MSSRLGYGLRGGALSAVTLETLSSSTLLFRSAARELTLVNTRVSCSFGLVNRILQPLSSVRLFAVSSETPEGFVLARHLSERHERTIQRMPAPRLVSSRLVSSRLGHSPLQEQRQLLRRRLTLTVIFILINSRSFRLINRRVNAALPPRLTRRRLLVIRHAVVKSH